MRVFCCASFQLLRYAKAKITRSAKYRQCERERMKESEEKERMTEGGRQLGNQCKRLWALRPLLVPLQ